MITLDQISSLASRPRRRENSVLTVYLDLDQSKQSNLNRGFENNLRNLFAGVRNSINAGSELTAFEAAAGRIEEIVDKYQIGARGLVAVSDASDGFIWFCELGFAVTNRIGWGREAIVEPLVVAVDEQEPVAIALFDRANLRLFTMVLGEVEEHVGRSFDHRKVRHTKTAGMNNLGASSHANHRADEEVRVNFQTMIQRIKSLVEQQGIQRLILAGSPEVTARLSPLLPKDLAGRLIGSMDVATSATLEEVRNAAGPIAEKVERETEQARVKELQTAAAKAGRVVVGLTETLDAVNKGRVWQLIYADGLHLPGYECSECAALFSESAPCAFCGAPTWALNDLIACVVSRVVRKGAKVEIVRGPEEASSLTAAGGIGAFLRTRTRSA